PDDPERARDPARRMDRDADHRVRLPVAGLRDERRQLQRHRRRRGDQLHPDGERPGQVLPDQGDRDEPGADVQHGLPVLGDQRRDRRQPDDAPGVQPDRRAVDQRALTGETVSPQVGDTKHADNGALIFADPTYGWFNPPATSVSYRWLR